MLRYFQALWVEMEYSLLLVADLECQIPHLEFKQIRSEMKQDKMER